MDVSLILGLLYINDWLLMLAVLLIATYYYSTWNYGYWESHGVPGPKPKFPMGTISGQIRHMDVRNARKYGQVYGTYEGRRPILMVHDPEILKSVFVRNHQDFANRSRRRGNQGNKLFNTMLTGVEGEQWRALRATVSQTFSTAKLKLMFEQIRQCAEDLTAVIDKEANTRKSFDLQEYAGRFATDVIATAAFGLKTESDDNIQFVAMAKKFFNAIEFNVGYLIMFFFPFLVPLIKALEIDFFPKDAQKFFKTVAQQAIEARKQSGQKRMDFLQLMMDAHNEPDEEKQEDKEHDKEFKEIYKGTAKRSLTMDEIIAQSILFLGAGYDTTATTITFLLYNLALHPEIQEKIHAEIENVTGNEGITYQSMSEMELLDMCTQESLRMYPPVMRIDRICSKDSKIGEMHIPKGMIITAPIYAIHHDPKIWPEPEKFDPYRFTPEEKAKHNSYDWMPFGAGPRNCIAIRLALLEVKVVVAHLVQKYKFVRSVDTEVPVELKNVMCTPKNGMWLKLERR